MKDAAAVPPRIPCPTVKCHVVFFCHTYQQNYLFASNLTSHAQLIRYVEPTRSSGNFACRRAREECRKTVQIYKIVTNWATEDNERLSVGLRCTSSPRTCHACLHTFVGLLPFLFASRARLSEMRPVHVGFLIVSLSIDY